MISFRVPAAPVPRRPRSGRARAVLCAAALLAGSGALAACGSDSEGAADTTVAGADTGATGASGPAAAALTLEVDGDATTPKQQTVPKGTEMTIHVTTKVDQEFHLHGYDIEQEGTDVTFQFTADQVGTFELESHATEQVVLELTVTG